MDAKDFTFNNGTDTKVVEYLSAVFPRISISILSNGLIIEAIDGSDLPSLVVASK